MTEPVVAFPVQKITIGQPYAALIRLEDLVEDDPVFDLTGYTVTWSLAEKPFATPFSSGSGEILTTDFGTRAFFEITEAITGTFGDYALPIIGGRISAVLQVVLTAPVAANSFLLQGPAIIQGKF